MKKLKVLIVDDAPLFVSVLKKVFFSFEETEIVGTASNGVQALREITLKKPDLVTLDIEMPLMNGLEVLKKMPETVSPPTILMVSSQNRFDADITMKCLKLGAYDFISKPEEKSLEQSIVTLTNEIRQHIKLLHTRHVLKEIAPPPVDNIKLLSKPGVLRLLSPRPKLITIASSTGGPTALKEIISRLSPNIPCPVIITQHMPPIFTKSLADSLNRETKLTVQESSETEKLLPGIVYICRGGGNTTLNGNSPVHTAVFTLNESVNRTTFSPNADVLLNSIPPALQPFTISVILTGMGSDGTEGIKNIYNAGGTVIAQDSQSCVVNGMPASAVKSGAVTHVINLDEIGAALNILTGAESNASADK